MIPTGWPAEVEGHSQSLRTEAFSVPSAWLRAHAVNQCVAVLQGTNTGNLQNAQGATQDNSKADDVDVGGSRLTMTPQLVQDCRQIILQVAAAQQPGVTNAARFRTVGSSMPSGLRAVGSNVATLAAIGPTRAVGSGIAELRAGAASLPRTGGMDPASLLALGAGVLLITRGILVYRMAQR